MLPSLNNPAHQAQRRQERRGRILIGQLVYRLVGSKRDARLAGVTAGPVPAGR